MLERRRVEEKSIPAGNIIPRTDDKEKRGKGSRGRRGRGKKQQAVQKELQMKPTSMSNSSPTNAYQSVLTQGFQSSLPIPPSHPVTSPSHPVTSSSHPIASSQSIGSPRQPTLHRQKSISFPLQSVRSPYPSQSLGPRPYQSPPVFSMQNQYVKSRISRDGSVLNRSTNYIERRPSEGPMIDNRTAPIIRSNLEGLNPVALPSTPLNTYRIALPKTMESSQNKDSFTLQSMNSQGSLPFSLDVRTEASLDQSSRPLLRAESVQNGNVYFSSNLSAQV